MIIEMVGGRHDGLKLDTENQEVGKGDRIRFPRFVQGGLAADVYELRGEGKFYYVGTQRSKFLGERSDD